MPPTNTAIYSVSIYIYIAAKDLFLLPKPYEIFTSNCCNLALRARRTARIIPLTRSVWKSSASDAFAMPAYICRANRCGGSAPAARGEGAEGGLQPAPAPTLPTATDTAKENGTVKPVNTALVLWEVSGKRHQIKHQ